MKLKMHVIETSQITISEDIVKVKFTASTNEDIESMNNLDSIFTNYLATEFGVLEILESNSPYFVLKVVRAKIGFGGGK